MRIPKITLMFLLVHITAFAQVKIAVVDAADATVQESSVGKLDIERTYVKGDKIQVTGADYLMVKVDKDYAETLLYAPKGKVIFPIPLWQTGKYAEKLAQPQQAFKGDKHTIEARAATTAEIEAYRNVALNPMDPRGESIMFPHASSKSEWGDAGVFAARCAIDGFVETTGDHHSWPRQSWGPYLPDDAHGAPELLVEFGRDVEIDKIVVVVRHNVRQDNHWKEATVEFSDGSSEKLEIKYNGERQEFPIAKRTVKSMKFVKLVPDKPGKYAAFVEVEAWGRDVK